MSTSSGTSAPPDGRLHLSNYSNSRPSNYSDPRVSRGGQGTTDISTAPSTSSLMWNMLDSGNYSDLTICSGGQEYKVHKVVICLQSPFFAKACDGEFQEAKSNRIILAEDDHDTVKRMITYFYIHDYDDEVHSTAFSQPNESCFQGRHMPMREQPALFSSIRVYALADKYDIQELKSLAESRFRIWATTYWIHPDFPDMVRDVYNSTPSTDRGLRNIVEKVLVDHALEVTEQPRFKELLVEIVELGLVVIHFGLKRIASAKFAETRSRG